MRKFCRNVFRSSEVKPFFKDEVKIRLISTKKQKKRKHHKEQREGGGIRCISLNFYFISCLVIKRDEFQMTQKDSLFGKYLLYIGRINQEDFCRL